jgi:hypothetical protein
VTVVLHNMKRLLAYGPDLDARLIIIVHFNFSTFSHHQKSLK